MIRDGIERKPPGVGGERAWWLLQMIGYVPLSFWTASGASVDQLIAAAKASDWHELLLQGWAQACERQRASDWVGPLITACLDAGIQTNLASMSDVVAEDQMEQMILSLLKRHSKQFGSKHPAFTLLTSYGRPWSAALSRAVLERISKELKDNKHLDWSLQSSIRGAFARWIDPLVAHEWIPRLIAVNEHDQARAAIDSLASLLQFRSDMLKEIAQ